MIFPEIEIGDSDSFWSSHGNTLRAKGKINQSATCPGSYAFDATLTTGNVFGSVRVTKTDHQNKHIITASFEPKLAEAMDAVLRFTLPSSLVSHISVDNSQYRHNADNIYRYLPEESDRLIVFLRNGRILSLQPDLFDETLPNDWKRRFYFRDEARSWIFHLRLMPTKGRVCMKNCTSWSRTKEIPLSIQKLLKLDPLEYMYKSENSPVRNPYIRRIWNPAAYTVNQLHSQFSLELAFSYI